MKAAIATTDGNILWEDHFGQSPFYQICEFDGEQWVKSEMRRNPMAEERKHARPEEIYQLLSDCDIFAAIRMGEKSRQVLNTMGIITHLRDAQSVEQMIDLLPIPYLSK